MLKLIAILGACALALGARAQYGSGSGSYGTIGLGGGGGTNWTVYSINSSNQFWAGSTYSNNTGRAGLLVGDLYSFTDGEIFFTNNGVGYQLQGTAYPGSGVFPASIPLNAGATFAMAPAGGAVLSNAFFWAIGGGGGSGGGITLAQSTAAAQAVVAPFHFHNYYVGTNGSDANNGTATNAPWLTISNAIAKVVAPATINILDGTSSNDYNDTLPLVLPDYVSLVGHKGQNMLEMTNSSGTLAAGVIVPGSYSGIDGIGIQVAEPSSGGAGFQLQLWTIRKALAL